MEKQQLTEDQNKKIKALQRSFALRMGWNGAKFAITLLVSSFIVGFIDLMWVHNQSFAFLGGLISGVFSFLSFRANSNAEYDRVKAEAKKILEA